MTCPPQLLGRFDDIDLKMKSCPCKFISGEQLRVMDLLCVMYINSNYAVSIFMFNDSKHTDALSM
jgi:hypothetical protein